MLEWHHNLFAFSHNLMDDISETSDATKFTKTALHRFHPSKVLVFLHGLRPAPEQNVFPGKFHGASDIRVIIPFRWQMKNVETYDL